MTRDQSDTWFSGHELFLDSSKLKEFADDNFEFNENGGQFSKRVENSVFKRYMLQTHKNQGPYSPNNSQEYSLSFSPRFTNLNVTQLLIG